MDSGADHTWPLKHTPTDEQLRSLTVRMPERDQGKGKGQGKNTRLQPQGSIAYQLARESEEAQGPGGVDI